MAFHRFENMESNFLTPHLYAAKSAYRQVGAAPFAALDLRAVGQLL